MVSVREGEERKECEAKNRARSDKDAEWRRQQLNCEREKRGGICRQELFFLLSVAEGRGTGMKLRRR